MRKKDAFPSKYLAAADIEDAGEITLTIKGVDWEEIKNIQTGKPEQRPVMTFKEREVGGIEVKPLIVNVTNWNAMEKLCGSDESDDWNGKRVTFYTTEVEAFGETKLAIRVRNKTKPQTANRPPAKERQAGDDDDKESE